MEDTKSMSLMLLELELFKERRTTSIYVFDC